MVREDRGDIRLEAELLIERDRPDQARTGFQPDLGKAVLPGRYEHVFQELASQSPATGGELDKCPPRRK